jgi:DNA invertase Pin-like site-specific DNA recombinase
MISINQFRDDAELRNEISTESKYEIVTFNGKPKFLVIDFDFAESMGGDIAKMIAEVKSEPKKGVYNSICDKKDLIVSMLDKGMTHKEIAKKLNVNLNSLYGALKRVGVKRDNRGFPREELLKSRDDVVRLIKDGVSVNAISIRYNVCHQTVNKYFKEELSARKTKRKNTTDYQFIQG